MTNSPLSTNSAAGIAATDVIDSAQLRQLISDDPLIRVLDVRTGGEFDSVKLDMVRRDIGAIASGQSAPTPSERDLKLIEASARSMLGRCTLASSRWGCTS